jgi:ABC-type Zn uptake system ZnuABC Zn-binding protein ZnuA
MKRPRKAAILLGLLAVTALAIWSGCGSLPDGWEGEPGPPRVLVSFPPLYSFVKNVGGDQAGVICLCTDVGPHEYEFNANDTIKLKRADLFLANGLTLDDHFTDKMVAGKKLRYRKLGEKLGDKKEGDLLKKGEEETPFDPHVWLGIPQAVAMVKRIRNELKEVDGGHADLYDENAKRYITRLEKLHHDGIEKLKGLKNVRVITFHDSMGYFADSFGLNILGAIEPRPGVEPSSTDLVDLVEKCRNLKEEEKQLVLIAVEPQYPEKAAEVVKKQIEDKKTGVGKAVIVTIDPLETCAHDDLSADWYIKKMQQNIDSLAKYAK